MNTCNSCSAQCCSFPSIKGPSSGIQRDLDWFIDGVGEYEVGNNIGEFLNVIKVHILGNIEPVDFFHDTSQSERRLGFGGIEVGIELEKNRLLFTYRILFICPEFDDDTKKCKNYDIRPKVCKDFKCDKLVGGEVDFDYLSRYKEIDPSFFFNSIDGCISWLEGKVKELSVT